MIKDACYMLPPALKSVSDMRPPISVRRTAAMGDAIAATVVCDRLIEQGFAVTYACHESFHPILALHRGISDLKTQSFIADVRLDGAYETDPRRTRMSFTELFVEKANAQLAHRGLKIHGKNGRPRLRPFPGQFDAHQRFFSPYPKPWVIIVPRATIQWHGRHVPNGIWQAAAREIHGTCFWLGQDPAPPGIIDLHCQQIGQLAPLICQADLVISVDTGPMHLAAALGKPVVAILQNSSPALHLSDQVDYEMVGPDLDCLNCQKNVCPINATTPPCQQVDPSKIAELANRKLRALTSEDVSCVIPIFRPTPERVNRCLAAIMPQVSEIVVTVDASGVVPAGLNLDSKTKIVHARLPRIGVGPNMNHGARYTSGKYILLLNDDVVLAPDAVARMLDCMKEDVGAVAHLLHYPGGQIYFANKVRSADGGIGHYHLDHRKFRHTITEPCESENLCGASMLVRRQAFYDAGCFDERFMMYAEDDCLSMNIRRIGYKLMYTPHALGIHEEGQSTRQIGERFSIMQQSNKLFGELWGEYYRHNKGNPGIGNFNYA